MGHIRMHGGQELAAGVGQEITAIPGGRQKPATTPTFPLAFRKHACDTVPVREASAHVKLSDGVQRGRALQRETQ